MSRLSSKQRRAAWRRHGYGAAMADASRSPDAYLDLLGADARRLQDASHAQKLRALCDHMYWLYCCAGVGR